MAKVGQISSDGSQCGSVYSDNGNSPTLTAGTHGDANSKVCTEYRIRKLTPKECWRLMDFSDADFHKAEKVNSNTQLYKQAGNSIVVNVLVAILGQLFIGKEDVYRAAKRPTASPRRAMTPSISFSTASLQPVRPTQPQLRRRSARSGITRACPAST